MMRGVILLLNLCALVVAVPVGIDLGTTYSCVAVMKNGRVEVMPNQQGNRITPSWVAFTANGERLVGDGAKNQAALNSANTLYDSKRFIGRKASDEVAAGMIKGGVYPFTVVANELDRPEFRVTHRGEELRLLPEDVSAMVLAQMKTIAEDYLGSSVTRAVVTVPAYFNDAQRQATKDAGRIAGLDVFQVLNEPTAAAIAYGLDRKGDKETVLVYDLGGGTFDVSLLTINNGLFEVIATNGNTHLGGEDFDHRVVEYFVGRFKMKHERDLRESGRAIAKLKREAEKAKRALSQQHTVVIEIESLFDGIDFRETLTRAKFEELNKDLFRSTLDPVNQVFKDSGLRYDDVDDIVLVGGSTRIPKVRDLLKLIFTNGKEPSQGVNPDEAVAYGAAVHAAVLSGETGAPNVILRDVTPLSLGIKSGATMATLIKRNTAVPCEKSKLFTTVKDNQSRVSVEVYEGERVLVKDNHFLGKFVVEGIPPAPRGKTQIKVTLAVDASGILTVTAQHKGYGSVGASMTIASDTGRLSEEEMEAMVAQADKFAAQDRALKELVAAETALETLVYSIRYTLADEEDIYAVILAEDEFEEERTMIEESIELASGLLEEEEATLEQVVIVTDRLRTIGHELMASLKAVHDEREAAAAEEDEEGDVNDEDEDDEPPVDIHEEL